MITLDKVAREGIFNEVTFKLRTERESHEKLPDRRRKKRTC